MSDAFDRGNAGDGSNGAPPPAPRAARTSGGFFSRFFAALLVIVITTVITLLAVAGIFFGLGFSLATPQQITSGQAGVATAQAQNNALQLQNNVIQTQIANLDRRNTQDRESLDEVRKTVADLNGLRAQLAASDVRSATAVAEARASGDQVAALATAEAGRVLVLSEIARRSERVERFLQRLSDISGDAAQDITGTSVSPSASVTASSVPTEPSASLGPSPTALNTPTALVVTARPLPTAPSTTPTVASPLPTARTATTPLVASPSAIAATPTSTPTR